LQLFSALYGIWVGHVDVFDCDVVRKLADEFLALAEKQATIVPRMIGHRMVAYSSWLVGDVAEALPHYDQAIALYDPAEHRALAAQFSQDARVTGLASGPWSGGCLVIPMRRSLTLAADLTMRARSA
jgi:hypothetical protein